MLEESLGGRNENALIVVQVGPQFGGDRQGFHGQVIAQDFGNGEDVFVLIVPIRAFDFLRGGGAVDGEDLR